MANSDTIGSRRGEVAVRTVAAVIGGFAVSNGFVASGTPLLMTLGVSRGDSLLVTLMLAFLVFTGVVILAFSALRWGRVSSSILVAGAVLLGIPYVFS